MTRDELLTKLRELKPWLAEQGVVNLRLFGSFARDEAGPESDVDLIVDIAKPMDAWAFLDLEASLGARLQGRRVEFCSERAMPRLALQRALREVVPV